MNVHLDPEIAQILQNSTSVSVGKGISNMLLKVSISYYCKKEFKPHTDIL